MIMSGNPKDAVVLEERSSPAARACCRTGALAREYVFGGCERIVVYDECDFEPAAGRGPGFYIYLFNPFIIARLDDAVYYRGIKEWYEAGGAAESAGQVNIL